MALPSINIEEDKNSIVRYIIHDVSQKRRMSNLPMAFSMELCLDLMLESAMFCYRKIRGEQLTVIVTTVVHYHQRHNQS